MRQLKMPRKFTKTLIKSSRLSILKEKRLHLF